MTGIAPNKGSTAGGTSVVITGTSFTGATLVSFGTSSASFTVNSATQITATSPAGAGTVDVTVTAPIGTSATSAADRFTYIPPPTVTSIAPNNGPIVGATAVTITGANFTGATAVRFGSNSATFTVSSATQIAANSPAGSAGTVDVTVTTPGGTSATSASDHFSYGSLQTWVSSLVGSDTNSCTRAAPCQTFSGAMASTIPGGEIDVLDPGDYGPLTITRAISIYNDTFLVGGIIPGPATSGIVINAGIKDVVNLRGLFLDGATASGTSGIVFNTGAGLNVENCVIQGFSGCRNRAFAGRRQRQHGSNSPFTTRRSSTMVLAF